MIDMLLSTRAYGGPQIAMASPPAQTKAPGIAASSRIRCKAYRPYVRPEWYSASAAAPNSLQIALPAGNLMKAVWPEAGKFI